MHVEASTVLTWQSDLSQALCLQCGPSLPLGRHLYGVRLLKLFMAIVDFVLQVPWQIRAESGNV